MYGLTEHLLEEDRYAEVIEAKYKECLKEVPEHLREDLSDAVMDIVTDKIDPMTFEFDDTRASLDVQWLVEESSFNN